MSPRDDHDDPETLSASQHGALFAQMALSVVPIVGSVIEKSVFGVLNERRQNRVVKTLAEFAERLDAVEREACATNEEFQSLLEDTIPAIARATSERRRVMLRNLLLNAARPSDGACLYDANYAGRLIAEIDDPGLALIAAAGRFAGPVVVHDGAPPFAFAKMPKVPIEHPPPPDVERYELPASFEVLVEWRRRLSVRVGNLPLFELSGVHAGPRTIEGPRCFELVGLELCALMNRWAKADNARGT